jgi:hypothetical protein
VFDAFGVHVAYCSYVEVLLLLLLFLMLLLLLMLLMFLKLYLLLFLLCTSVVFLGFKGIYFHGILVEMVAQGLLLSSDNPQYFVLSCFKAS